MKRLSELQNEKAYYESLLIILEKIHNPSADEFDTICKAKEKTKDIIQEFCINIQKIQKIESKWNKYSHLIFVLLFIAFVFSVICFSLVIANKVNQLIGIIPILLITIILIVSLLIGLIAIPPHKLVYFFTFVLIVVTMLIYFSMNDPLSNFKVALFLQIIPIVNFAFGLYDRIKKA
jgi:hypothetical protein